MHIVTFGVRFYFYYATPPGTPPRRLDSWRR